MARSDTIWEMVRQASQSLPEPFSRSAILGWIERRRPDVEPSSVGVHIQLATANATNASNPFGNRTPLLVRVDRGLYRRYRSDATQGPDPAVVPSPPAEPPFTGSLVAAAAAAAVVLVGCSSSKAATAHPAAELFTGAAFVKARDHAVGSGRPWYVLSAKFGLLAPDEVVTPYDVYLADQSSRYREAWGTWVVAQLAEREQLTGAVVEVHAGRAYCDPLVAPLAAVGATLNAPLAGLRQGERLGWYGSGSRVAEPPMQDPARAAVPDVGRLVDERTAVSPATFLGAGRAAADAPGLYSWWVDTTGAHDLSAGLGHRVEPGLIYAGRAGGQRASGKVSTNTLWGRIATMHLGGNRNFSTFRLTLAAVLTSAGLPMDDEAALTAWMQQHLRVATLPLPAEHVFAAEQGLLEFADPPLNLRDVEKTPLRRRLTELRSELSDR